MKNEQAPLELCNRLARTVKSAPPVVQGIDVNEAAAKQLKETKAVAEKILSDAREEAARIINEAKETANGESTTNTSADTTGGSTEPGEKT